MQRKCKSNAEYQACLNILLRCRFSSAKKMQTSAMKAAFKLPSAGFLLQRYNKKQLFAIVCSDFVLKSAHIFAIYADY